jgi:hypothetical protein
MSHTRTTGRRRSITVGDRSRAAIVENDGVFEPGDCGSQLLELEHVGNRYDVRRTRGDVVTPSEVGEQLELRRDDIVQIRFDVAKRTTLREVEPRSELRSLESAVAPCRQPVAGPPRGRSPRLVGAPARAA